jgi:chemotaxis protein methyltransferase CheR
MRRFIPRHLKPAEMEQSSPKINLPVSTSPDISPEAFEMIRRILKNLNGFNLDSYKDKCIKRRISIRIRATNCKTAEAYCELLLNNEAELDLLLKVLTIHVSHFYRNPPTFEKLKREIFPSLFSRCKREGRDDLKLWSVGCASGEEPYTLALILKDNFSADMQGINVSILATDVDAATLEVAKQAAYHADRLAEVPDSIKTRYFEQGGAKYQLMPEITKLVTFRQGDLSNITSYPKSDLILCRNVLIYFERSQQEKILNGFADALSSGGVLVLGKSETLVGETRQRFRTICPVERIYRVD